MDDRMRVTSFMGGTAFELSVEFAGVYSVSRVAAIACSSGATPACEEARRPADRGKKESTKSAVRETGILHPAPLGNSWAFTRGYGLRYNDGPSPSARRPSAGACRAGEDFAWRRELTDRLVTIPSSARIVRGATRLRVGSGQTDFA